jgi:hypothetical protein
MNGYHEEPACEHRYLDGSTCGDRAAFAVAGVLLCEEHFEDRVVTVSLLADGERRAAELRCTAQALPAPAVAQADGAGL